MMNTDIFNNGYMHKLWKTGADKTPITLWYYDMFGEMQQCELGEITSERIGDNISDGKLYIESHLPDMSNSYSSCWLVSYSKWRLEMYKKHHFYNRPIHVDESPDCITIKFCVPANKHQFIANYETLYLLDNDFIDVSYENYEGSSDFIVVQIDIMCVFCDFDDMPDMVVAIIENAMLLAENEAVFPFYDDIETRKVYCFNCHTDLCAISHKKGVNYRGVNIQPRINKCPNCGMPIMYFHHYA